MIPADLIIRRVGLLDCWDGPGPGDGWLALASGEIIARGRDVGWTELPRTPDCRLVDGAGAMLTPGFVDMHCHGAAGGAFDDGPEAAAAALAAHRAHGVDGVVMSLVSREVDELCARLRAGARLVGTLEGALGLHAEGPFLSAQHKGAHDVSVLRAPDPEAVEAILEAADGRLRSITLAPELPGGLAAVETFVAHGVAVAIGHTAASYDQAAAAFDAGASVLTHVFNGMPGLHHRAPGPVAAALDAEHATLELINDGVHVQGPAARIVARCAGDRLALVSDAMAAAGMGDGRYRLGDLPVLVEDGTARTITADGSVGSIAGSTLTLDRAADRAVAQLGMSPAAAVAAVTRTPARATDLDVPDLQVGTTLRGDLVIRRRDFSVVEVVPVVPEEPAASDESRTSAVRPRIR